MSKKIRAKEAGVDKFEQTTGLPEFDNPSHEKNENSPNLDKSVEHAQKSVERDTETQEPLDTKEYSSPRNDTMITKLDKQHSYKSTMSRVQSQLPVLSKRFSKVIHAKAIEGISAGLEKTIARPSAILSGSFFAFVGSSVMLFYAKRNGFELSGSETIFLFVFGWVIGLLIEIIWRKIIKRR